MEGYCLFIAFISIFFKMFILSFQIENHLDSLRDEIKSWETIDALKTELRTTLRNKKEEVKMLEQNPSRLPEAAAEMEIVKLQVRAKKNLSKKMKMVKKILSVLKQGIQ